MGFASLIRQMVALADNITGTLQVTITHARFIEDNDESQPVYADPVAVDALVDLTPQPVSSQSGQVFVSVAMIFFPRPYEVHLKDQFFLPDGTTAPIIDTGGFLDKGTGRGFFNKIMIGKAQ